MVFSLLFMGTAWAEESWVFFYIEKEYFFEPPHMGIPLKPLYQRETYYYDENSLQTSGLLAWKTAKAKVKIESWGAYNNAERIRIWEIDCAKKVIKTFTPEGRPLAPLSVDAGNEAADAFYDRLCF